MVTIVLIDDDRSWAQAVTDLLREQGLVVLTAEDGEQGLQLLERTKAALVILDVDLPRVGGLEILRELRQADFAPPVLMVSANDQAMLITEAMAAGASAFLRKPISPVLLQRTIERLIPTAR